MIAALREQWAPLVICLGVFVAALVMFVHPAGSERDSAEAMLESVLDELDTIDSSEAAHTIHNPEGRRVWIETLAELGADAVDEHDVLQDLVVDSGLRLLRIDPSGSDITQTNGPYRVHTQALRVNASGSYENVATALSRLSAHPMIIVDECTVQRGTSASGALDVVLRARLAQVQIGSGRIADGETP